MGKTEEHRLHLQQQQIQGNRSGTVLCQRCSIGLSRIGQEFNLKCVVVLIFSLSVFLSAVFWVLPRHKSESGFDADYAIKLRASVQASFRLQKPVSVLVQHIGRLEYDIYSEIGVPYTKVAILSMHRADACTWTNVVFGVLSDPIDAPINPVFLSVLRSSLIELFLHQSNLTLTTSIVGEASSLEVLKYPGGITIIPDQSASIWQISQILFNFTLHNSIYEIKENLAELKQQLKLGLHLRSYENVYVQVTNRNGSTRDPPVTVQAAIMSDLGILLPQRLKQLAQLITGSPPDNLGLNNTVFGKVKEVSLSSFLNSTILATPPTPSPAPAPAPEQNKYAQQPISPSPNVSPPDPPAPGPHFHLHSYSPSPENYPDHSFPPMSSSSAPSVVGNRAPRPSPHLGYSFPPRCSPSSKCNPAAAPYPPPVGAAPKLSPGLSPLPDVSYGSSGRREKGSAKGLVSSPLASPPISPSPSSSAICLPKAIWSFTVCGFLTFHLLCWS